ncbi:MAG: penicillin acylase family protein [Maribacter sp.]|uniref:penicillin acylase family protein n=1 Tax=Maribacter sp. TaxID=1897614 RepID=UPI003299C654
MKKLKKVGLILLVIVGILLIAGVIFSMYMKPDYSGKKALTDLAENVNVYYDNYGIPHIYGNNEEDAFRALGYVHAQDRLWQMEVLRRIGRGGLSEVFGPDLLSTDKFFLSLGIDENSAKTVAALDLNTQEIRLSQAYLDGINQFIADGPKPIEFYLTGLKREPFTLKDIYNTMGYMAFSFAQAHKTDPFLTTIKNKLGSEYLVDLGVDVDPNTTWIQNYPPKASDSIENNITAMVTDALNALSVPLFEGSNSWVIAPEKTKNGKVIFANDPHIGFAQPSVWYEAHLNAPNYEKYGYHLAGVPFPMLGHNRDLAYGMTMFENDDVDFYYEVDNPANKNQYKTHDGWKDYELVTKTIKVKDEEEVVFTFKRTDHGPVLNGIANQITEERPISMSWIYTKGENKVMKAVYGMTHATNLKEFEAALPNIHAPGLNIMYGDAKGNVAWWASAQLYQIPDSINTKMVFESEMGLDENKTLLPFTENPQAINPPWKYVYSANNQPDSIAGMKYPGYYLPENRAKRIVELLQPKNDWDKLAVGAMITDVTSSVNPEILKDLANELDIKQLSKKELNVLDRLIRWKGDYPLESIEGTVYHRWVYRLLRNTFSDELGLQGFEDLMSTHMSKRLIAPIIKKDHSIWWDDVHTKEVKETKKVIIQMAFKEAMASLIKDFGEVEDEWRWERVHSLEHEHPIGKVAALRSFFNVGPFPVHGSREVINNLGFRYTSDGFYKVGSGPSTRRVIDFSDIENSMSILPTGQSGNPFSRFYEDQAEMFLKGEFRKMMLNKNEILEKAHSKLVFIPR